MSDDLYDGAYVEVMGRRVRDTPLVNLDLHLIGEAVLNAIGASLVMGHVSPASTLDYMPEPGREDHISQHIVRDLLAWTSRRTELAEGCDERLSTWVRTHWLPSQTALLAESLGVNEHFGTSA